MMKFTKNLLILLAITTISFYGCADEFIETKPTANVTGGPITDLASAQSYLNGTYSALQTARNFGGYTIFMTGLWADDLAHTGSFPNFAELRGNDPALNNSDVQNYWDEHYDGIFRANKVINETAKLNVFDTATQNSIIAQARVIRALEYYTLIKVFGGVPIIETAYQSLEDIDKNPAPRSTVSQVYDFIIDDVTFAVDNLNNGGSPYFINQAAARVLKAKVEMELGLFPEAELTLAPVLTQYELASTYESLFTGTANTQEAIFAIDFNDVDGGNHGFFFLDAGRGEVGPTNSLKASFESGDLRINEITPDNEIGKYKDAGNGNDDAYIFRFADVLLMQAELLARKDDATASSFINRVRRRAGLTNDVTINSTNFIDLIAQERRVELYAEGFDRLFTITRLNIADDIISNKPNNTFISERNNLWPIPQQEIERNPLINVADQNAGY